MEDADNKWVEASKTNIKIMLSEATEVPVLGEQLKSMIDDEVSALQQKAVLEVWGITEKSLNRESSCFSKSFSPSETLAKQLQSVIYSTRDAYTISNTGWFSYNANHNRKMLDQHKSAPTGYPNDEIDWIFTHLWVLRDLLPSNIDVCFIERYSKPYVNPSYPYFIAYPDLAIPKLNKSRTRSKNEFGDKYEGVIIVKRTRAQFKSVLIEWSKYTKEEHAELISCIYCCNAKYGYVLWVDAKEHTLCVSPRIVYDSEECRKFNNASRESIVFIDTAKKAEMRATLGEDKSTPQKERSRSHSKANSKGRPKIAKRKRLKHVKKNANNNQKVQKPKSVSFQEHRDSSVALSKSHDK